MSAPIKVFCLEWLYLDFDEDHEPPRWIVMTSHLEPALGPAYETSIMVPGHYGDSPVCVATTDDLLRAEENQAQWRWRARRGELPLYLYDLTTLAPALIRDKQQGKRWRWVHREHGRTREGPR
jgi:hypothetical protein